MTEADVDLANYLDHVAGCLADALEVHEARTGHDAPCVSGRAKALARIARWLGFSNEAQVLLVAHHWSRIKEQK